MTDHNLPSPQHPDSSYLKAIQRLANKVFEGSRNTKILLATEDEETAVLAIREAGRQTAGQVSADAAKLVAQSRTRASLD